jgi:hypothetical protein
VTLKYWDPSKPSEKVTFEPGITEEEEASEKETSIEEIEDEEGEDGDEEEEGEEEEGGGGGGGGEGSGSEQLDFETQDEAPKKEKLFENQESSDESPVIEPQKQPTKSILSSSIGSTTTLPTPLQQPTGPGAELEYECIPLPVIYVKGKTGLEETKDFPIHINSVIAGRYQILEYLGSAAFSKAIRCADIKTNMQVCIKIIKNNKEFLDQSLDEIKLLQYINSKGSPDEMNVLQLYGIKIYGYILPFRLLLSQRTFIYCM